MFQKLCYNNNMTSYTITVEQDPETGDLVLPFTPEMLAQVGWDFGDVIVWTPTDHGSFILTKKEDNGN